MKFCQAHWDQLRDAIKTRGIWPLVARNGMEAAERFVEELEGKASDASWDPLMAAHWAIGGRATEILGLYIFGTEVCPVCEVLTVHDSKPCEHGCTHDDVEKRWIEGPADAMLKHVRDTPVLLALCPDVRA